MDHNLEVVHIEKSHLQIDLKAQSLIVVVEISLQLHQSLPSRSVTIIDLRKTNIGLMMLWKCS